MPENIVETASQGIDEREAVEQTLDSDAVPAHSDVSPVPKVESAEPAPVTLSTIRAALKQVDTQLRQFESQLQVSPRLMPAPALPQQQSASQARFSALALLTIILVVGVRVFKLNTLQTDLYGDIQIVHQYVENVLSGIWPFEYNLSAGPLYHYLISPIIALVGPTYLGYKLASIMVSLGALAGSYLIARRLVSDSFALLATFVAGVSSWLLIFSRLGNSQIMVPMLVTWALWLMICAIQNGHPAYLVACALVSTLGLYAYPPSFVLAPTIWVTMLCLRWAGHPVSWRMLIRFALFSMLAALPFVWIVYQSPDNFTTGYIGGKIYAEGNPLTALMNNTISVIFAYHVRGDVVFRNNPSNLPHLDQISGVLLIIGIVFWLRPAGRRWGPVLLVPFVLLHLPSLLVLAQPSEVPSAARTLGVAPIAYILVASGVWWLVQSFQRFGWQRLGLIVAGSLLAGILVLNMQRYFEDYINGLPYHDVSIGERIALYADTLPPDTQVYVVGCCWAGDLPELLYVQIVASRPQNLHQLDAKGLTCDQLALLPEHSVLIWSFDEAIPAAELSSCKQWLPAQLYLSPKGWPVFYAAPLLRDRV